jgi:hypothetical protein
LRIGEIRVFVRGDGSGKTGRNRIDKNKIATIEKRLLIVYQRKWVIRQLACHEGYVDDDPFWCIGRHVQEDRGIAGATVEQECYGAVFMRQVITRIGHVKDRGLGILLAGHRVFLAISDSVAGFGRKPDFFAVQGHRMPHDGWGLAHLRTGRQWVILGVELIILRRIELVGIFIPASIGKYSAASLISPISLRTDAASVTLPCVFRSRALARAVCSRNVSRKASLCSTNLPTQAMTSEFFQKPETS